MMINPYVYGFSAVAPVNVAPPVLAGRVFAGHTLTITPGTWTGTPVINYSYQFLADGVPIPGATGLTYLVDFTTEYKTITAIETATGPGGSNAVATNSRVRRKMSDYNNCALNLDGADLSKFTIDSTTTPGTDLISTWAGSEGQSREMYGNGVVLSSDIANIVNGRPTPYWNGATAYGVMDSNLHNFHNQATGTIIITCKSDGPNNSDRALIGGQNGSTIVLSAQQRATGPRVRFRSFSSGTNNSDTNTSLGTAPRVWVMRKDAGTLRPYIDVTAMNTTVSGGVVLTRLEIGRFAAFPTQLWKGPIMDVTFFNDTKSIADINDIRAEVLAPAWGTNAVPI